MLLAGKKVVVVGGSSGIGFSTAELAKREGAEVVIASHNPEVIDYLAADSVWLFEREEGGPAHVRPLPIEPDSGLKASEQLQRGWTLGA